MVVLLSIRMVIESKRQNETMKTTIEPYDERYSIELKQYLFKIYPLYSEKYINYIITHAIDHNKKESPALLVLNEKGKIVGCHFYYYSKAKIHGEIKSIKWGHDTFVEESYRGCGLATKIDGLGSYGIGLSETNVQIRKKKKATFFEGLNNYLIPNYRIVGDIIKSILGIIITKKTISPAKIKINDYHFSLVENANDIRIPNNGFWNETGLDIDFIRDVDFLKIRFFDIDVHKYFFYQCEEKNCYFVFRIISFKKVKTLFLVDYRYLFTEKDIFPTMMKAVKKLVKLNQCGAILCLSNDTEMAKYSKNHFGLKSPYTFTATRNLGIPSSYKSLVTAGDSDADFLRN